MEGDERKRQRRTGEQWRQLLERQALNNWQKSNPEIFHKRVHNLTGLNIYKNLFTEIS